MRRYAKRFLSNTSSVLKNFPPTFSTMRTASTAVCRKLSKTFRATLKLRKLCARASRPLCSVSHLPDQFQKLGVAFVLILEHPEGCECGAEQYGSRFCLSQRGSYR